MSKSAQHLSTAPASIYAITREEILRSGALSIPDPLTPEYTELAARFAWWLNDRFEIAVKGFNLLNETHRQYAEPEGHLLRRSVLAELRFSY